MVAVSNEGADVAEVDGDAHAPGFVIGRICEIQRISKAHELAVHGPALAVPIHEDRKPAAHVSSVIVSVPSLTTSLRCSSPLPAWSIVQVGSSVPTMLPSCRPASMPKTPAEPRIARE